MAEQRTSAELIRDFYIMSADEVSGAVAYHNALYWNDDAAVIPDELYDRLVQRLRSLSPDSPLLDAIGPAGAVTPEEAGALDGAPRLVGDKVEHASPMLSLDKAYDAETVHKWFANFDGGALASPKVDGIACSIRYDATGAMLLASTRGDGSRGDIITENVKRVGAVPSTVDAASIEVRGEVYMPVSVFRSFEGHYANPRNLAAGALKHKDPEETAPYGLRFFAYDLRGEDHPTEEAKFARLVALGFEPVEVTPVETGEVQEYYDGIVARRHGLDYETDGVVFRTNRIDEQVRLGATAHHPRFAIAYKFQGESGTSTLVDVHWSVSRTGAINPVAIVEPVTLSGASVTRATLHNLAYVESLGLSIGALLLMTRRGGVIPAVESVVQEGETPIAFPERCPSCGNGPTERRGDVLFCPDQTQCTAAQLSLLKHYVDAVDCRDFGPVIIEQLFEQGLVREPADFYALRTTVLVRLDRVGEKSAQNLVDNINAARRVGLDRFLQALAIPDLGKVASGAVAAHFGTIGAVRAASAQELAEIFGIGETTGKTIHDGLAERASIIDRLLDEVILEAVEAKAQVPIGGPLAGMRVLFTGTLASMKRKDAQARVRALGGLTPSGVVRELDYLVLGDADMARFEGGWRSSKLKKVDTYNANGAAIEVLGESAFLALIPEDA